MQTGITTAIITTCTSLIIAKRAHDLNISYVYQGQTNKLPAYEELKQKLQLTDDQIAYIADDLPDLPLLRRVGLSVTVPNAPQIIKDNTIWITQKKAGKGAVREFCELIMKAQGTYQNIIESYLKQ